MPGGQTRYAGAAHGNMRTVPSGEDPGRRRRNLHRSPRHTIVGRVRTGIGLVLLVVVLAVAGFVTFSVVSGSWNLAPILSGSMQPGFPVGGVAVAEREPVSHLALRDVIIFKNPFDPKIQMVHRIISLKFSKSGEPIIKTHGDANTAPDPWTVRVDAKYIYVVQFTLPLLGYPGVYTNHGLDLIVAGVILLLVVGGTVLSRDRDDRSPPGGYGPGRTTDWPTYIPASTRVKAGSGAGPTPESPDAITEPLPVARS